MLLVLGGPMQKTPATKRKPSDEPVRPFLPGFDGESSKHARRRTHDFVPSAAAWDNGDTQMLIVLLAAAALHPCVGSWEWIRRVKVPRNIAPSKKSARNINLVIKECLQHQSATIPHGFHISKRTMRIAIPTALELFDARLYESQTASGDADANNTSELDSALETLMAAIEDSEFAAVSEWVDRKKKKTADTAGLKAFSADVREQGLFSCTLSKSLPKKPKLPDK